MITRGSRKGTAKTNWFGSGHPVQAGHWVWRFFIIAVNVVFRRFLPRPSMVFFCFCRFAKTSVKQFAMDVPPARAPATIR